METTSKKSSKKTESAPADQRIREAYMKHLLLEGQRPVSVYKFCLELGIREEEFYSHFGSFDGIERLIWKEFIDNTIHRLRVDESFATFSAREKILAFYFTFFEELKSQRSFAIHQLDIKPTLQNVTPPFLKDFRVAFEAFIDQIMMVGKSTGEVARRPYVENQYPSLFWFHFAFLMNYWKTDDSKGFERTDAAIEKSVNLAFDLIGKGAFDSAVDFAKFLYQSRGK